MPGSAIQVGPFVGGLNTFSDPSAIADNELAVCENFELDLDGSLKSRPPIEDLEIDFPLDSLSGNIKLLGYYYDTNNSAYLLASDGNSSTYYFTGSSWVLVTDTFAAAAFIQYNDKAWLAAPYGSVNPGGYWLPATGFFPDANMPKGECLVAFKGRLWIAEGKDTIGQGTRLYRSQTLADPSLWVASNDFIDIGSGDGQNIVQIVVYFNSLLIFRLNSIYSLQYTSDPAAAVVSLIVPNIGLNSVNALDIFENYIYFMYDDKAYEFSNNKATQINVKVPFTSETTTGIYMPFVVSEFNNRIVFSYYDKMYVYNLRTRSWTNWVSESYGCVRKLVRQDTALDTPVVITHSTTSVPIGPSRVGKTLKITDEAGTAVEEMECTLRTKNYNYQASSVYKRLFWWGLDATFKGDVVGTASAITYTYSVIWQTLFNNEDWQNMTTFTWGSPQAAAPEATTTVTENSAANVRSFVKFLKSLRFRQIYFTLIFQSDGSASSAPVRVFSIMTYVNPKQTVSKELS